MYMYEVPYIITTDNVHNYNMYKKCTVSVHNMYTTNCK